MRGQQPRIFYFEVIQMPIRGIRGAIDVQEDSAEEILRATRVLLTEILQANPGLQSEEIASVIFTSTEDLISAYPARAAREMGWQVVPMICSQEIPVPGGLPRCIRVLLHWNTDLTQREIHHVYLGQAENLRPDLTKNNAP
jgi:chorismate mutase